MSKYLELILKPSISVLFALAVGLSIAGLVGENPLGILMIFVRGVTGSSYDVGMTIYYMGLLCLSGLAVAIPYRAGLFNIGAEGQILVGAFAAAIAGTWMPSGDAGLSRVFYVFLILMCGALSGALWGAIAGWIRAYRGGHEVISSIMLNFLGASLTSWLTLDFFRSTTSQSPETSELEPSLMLSRWPWAEGAPVGPGVFLPFLAVLVMTAILKWHRFGFEWKAIKASEGAATLAGIPVRRQILTAMMVGGLFSGLAGSLMVLLTAGKFRLEMSDGVGFLGIPVALLAGGRALAILPSAFLFAALYQGGAALDLEAQHVNRDLSQVMQAMIVLLVGLLMTGPTKKNT